ncbi:hypothetical protein L3Q82_001973 [Scortum barcoo]|uniref:Uncharacterized protein n=1 Tax=Scortum barcoo TaxID=214431 RepID=A0ACB8W2Y4_9TELE|nr:hypothetical protein L3Q82_001973 [Scortum barcoo]
MDTAFCKALGATPSLSSGYHPQPNGQTERANQSLKTALRCVAARNPASWSTQLAWVEYAHNSLTPLHWLQEEDTAFPCPSPPPQMPRSLARALEPFDWLLCLFLYKKMQEVVSLDIYLFISQ